jgi:RecJ-like exonuclease
MAAIDPAERMREIVARAFPQRDNEDPGAGDEAAIEAPSVAEDICPRCAGDGMVGQDICSECEGTGRVIEPDDGS